MTAKERALLVYLGKRDIKDDRENLAKLRNSPFCGVVENFRIDRLSDRVDAWERLITEIEIEGAR